MATNNHVLQIFFKLIAQDDVTLVCDDDMENRKILKISKSFSPVGIIDDAIKIFGGDKIKFKAVVLVAEIHPFKIRQILKNFQEVCKSKNLFFCTVNPMEAGINGALSETKTMVSEKEFVIIGLICGSSIEIQLFIRARSGYQFHCKRKLSIDPAKPKATFEMVSKLVAELPPKKIVLITTHSLDTVAGKSEKELAICFKRSLKNYEVIICDQDFVHLTYKTSHEMALHKMGDKPNPYFCHAIIYKSYFLLLKPSNGILNGKKDEGMSVPCQEMLVFEVKPIYDSVQVVIDNNEVVETISLAQYLNKQVQLTFHIDENKCYNLSLQHPEAEKFEMKFDKALTLPSSIHPKIVLRRHEFVLYIKKGNLTNMVKTKNGQEETPLFIGFNDKKPIIGEEAQKLAKENPAFVIYDLMKLCTITDPKEANPKWPFIVKMDENQEIRVEFETADGKKAASPAFLMALVFRECLSRLKKKTSMKLTKLFVKLDGIKAEPALSKTLEAAAKLVNAELELL